MNGRERGLKALALEPDAQDSLDMGEYGHASKVVVDIITLDSEACAPVRRWKTRQPILKRPD